MADINTTTVAEVLGVLPTNINSLRDQGLVKSHRKDPGEKGAYWFTFEEVSRAERALKDKLEDIRRGLAEKVVDNSYSQKQEAAYQAWAAKNKALVAQIKSERAAAPKVDPYAANALEAVAVELAGLRKAINDMEGKVSQLLIAWR